MTESDRRAEGPKLFVLDTNVVLHDAQCVQHFEENDVVVPLCVLEELDKFKRGSEDKNFQARAFLRFLDEMAGDALDDGGVSMGPNRGRIRVAVESSVDDRIRRFMNVDTADHRILNTALRLQERAEARRVVLLSKDTNLRLKAKSLGLVAQDYTTDKVRSVEELYTGRRTVEGIDGERIGRFYEEEEHVPAGELAEVDAPRSNENFILRNGSKSVLARYDADSDEFVRIPKMSAFDITPRNAEQSFALSVLTDDDIRLVTLAGPAGTGKTLLALASALECRSRYRQILLARPVVPLSNKDIGYLPGDIDAKIDPYMHPLFDNLGVIKAQLGENSSGVRRIQTMWEQEKIVITPLAYLRGRSLQRAFFIVDEAQNLTPHEVKTIITRAGEGTKIVLTGDIAQIDQPYLDARSNGLSYLISRMVGQSIYAHVTLERGERSELADLASKLL